MSRSPLALAVLLLAVACASPAPGPTLSIRVENRSGAEVRAIHIKDCERDESALAPLPDTELSSGRSVTFELPSSCVDLVAYDRGGRVVGEQRALHALPGTTWTLR